MLPNACPSALPLPGRLMQRPAIRCPSQNGGKARPGDLLSAPIEQRPPPLLRLQVLVRDVHCANWRWAEPAECLPIADLHRVVRLRTGRCDDHLHRVRIHRRDCGITYTFMAGIANITTIRALSQYVETPEQPVIARRSHRSDLLPDEPSYARQAGDCFGASASQ